MLLNQCLAISLSPVTTNDEVKSAQENGSGGFRGREAQQQPVSLFQQLVEQNTARQVRQAKADPDVQANNYQLNEPNQVTIDDQAVTSSKLATLSEAVKRIQLAGFVLPTWLLLSGSYNDLHCLKTSWSEGHFKSPAGYKIETIGKCGLVW